MKQSGRKWKDDSEVVSCTSCSQTFSLTNRKHHCRNCGDIFCKDCSSKQVSTLSILSTDHDHNLHVWRFVVMVKERKSAYTKVFVMQRHDIS